MSRPALLRTAIPGALDPGGFLYLALVLTVVAANIAPIWQQPYFPSQDGPSHIYNATIMADLGSEPVYQEFFSLRLTPAGNLLGHVLLGGLLRFLEPAVAEKAAVTIILLLHIFAFYYLGRTLTENGRYFCLFGLMIGFSFFLFMGFWNFCLAVPIGLLGLGYYLRNRDDWRIGNTLVLCVIVSLTYAAHMMVCFVAGAAIGAFALAGFAAGSGTGRHWSRRLLEAAKPALAFVPVAPLAIAYLHTGLPSDGSGEHGSLWDLYGFGYLQMYLHEAIVLRKLLALFVAGLVILAILGRIRRPRIRYADTYLALATLFALATAFGPSHIGQGGTVRTRLGLFFLLFLLLWLSSQQWPKPVQWGIVFALSLLLLAGASLRADAYRRWNQPLLEIVSVQDEIREGATVLGLDLDRLEYMRPNLHAVGRMTARRIINLRNYEAATDHFLTRYQPAVDPYRYLGDREGLEATPPRFDLDRYENHSGRRVDYLLAYSTPEDGEAFPERRLYSSELERYRLVTVSRPTGFARLYEAKSH